MPGRAYTITATSGGSFPTHLSDVSENVKLALAKLGASGVAIWPKERVEGNSWEMAAVMSALGRSGAYTGTCAHVSDSAIYFGAVPLVSMKKTIIKHLKTYKDIPFVHVPS
jgi:hypothetical protein